MFLMACCLPAYSPHARAAAGYEAGHGFEQECTVFVPRQDPLTNRLITTTHANLPW
ncbi:hypothetical protein RBA41_22270 [Massilia sp. CCM 9210]|uniref:hypothetical protein n=1 Tax=Massilia scottii TaxID=3057166 RepID=UPI00279689D1|nr:hypothetical protein [Massilia sp. CCM 9210]MDQ1816028.1 hypothetical protein [Massilia sp. CCM 9210]